MTGGGAMRNTAHLPKLSYANDTERRQKMLAARKYVEGWCDGLALGALPWANIPQQYEGRWSFDFNEKRGEFVVHCGGYGILYAEDSEIVGP